MIIVAGHIKTKSGSRNTFLKKSRGAMKAARERSDCIDFVVAADPIDADRVIVFEAWKSVVALENFRSEGPGDNLTKLIKTANVRRHYVSRSGPA